jgi:hypothetical protein
MAYNNEVHALKQLLSLQECGGSVTRTPTRIMNFPDGPYYFVEVSSKEGTKYVIEAYGEEAVELSREAWRI